LSKILHQQSEPADYCRSLFPVSELQICLEHLRRSAVASCLFPKLPSPNEFFFGFQLPLVFEKHFKRKAGLSRPWEGQGPITGPFIRFAQAVGRALGEEVAAETVAKAMKSKITKRDQRSRPNG
jgi:hypothetical protein